MKPWGNSSRSGRDGGGGRCSGDFGWYPRRNPDFGIESKAKTGGSDQLRFVVPMVGMTRSDRQYQLQYYRYTNRSRNMRPGG